MSQKVIRLILILFAALSPAAAQALSGVVSTPSGVNLRSSPNGSKLGALPRGTSFTVLRSVGIWYKIRLANGRTGFVWKNGVRTGGGSGNAEDCDTPSAPSVSRQASEIARAAEAGGPISTIVQGRHAPIMRPFTLALRECAPGCTYDSWGVWGDARHQRRRSCHNTGNAIDVPAIRCGGRRYNASTSRFRNFVGCVRGKHGLYTIFGSGDHKQHVHISLRSCEINGIGKVRVR